MGFFQKIVQGIKKTKDAFSKKLFFAFSARELNDEFYENLEEALLALAICASSDETAKKALEQLTNLNGCQAHSTFILKEVDEEALRKLGINVTSDAKFLSNDLIQ